MINPALMLNKSVSPGFCNLFILSMFSLCSGRWLVLLGAIILLPIIVVGQIPSSASKELNMFSAHLDLVGGTTLRNSLTTNYAKNRLLSSTMYNAKLEGQQYFRIGLAPTVRFILRHIIVSAEFPVAYETEHSYSGSRPFPGPYNGAWPDSLGPWSYAKLRGDYVTARSGLRITALPTQRLRPFVGAQLGFAWALNVRENVYLQNNPYGWAFRDKFLGGDRGGGGTGILDYATAALLFGVEAGRADRRVLSVAVSVEIGTTILVYTDVAPVWRSLNVTASYSLVSLTRRK
jgi:hypothetical protein